MTMIPAKKTTPVDWMLYPECRTVMDLLNEGAEVPQALFVGGCVRNLLLDKPVEDLDIATIHTPQTVQQKCRDAGLSTIPTGIVHGTVTVLVGARSFEVTTLRRDVTTDGRRATVAFSEDWAEDAARRDFTMNTLLADLEGDIYDPTGQGVSDLEAGRVIFVGSAERRIEEDYLRILRFFRFHAYYGQGVPDAAALQACAALSDNIPKLSRERISQEFYKILMAENVANVLKLISQNNVLSDVVLDDLEGFERFVDRQVRASRPHLDARLYMLVGGQEALENFSETYFIYSNAQKKVFAALEALYIRAQEMNGEKEMIYRFGAEMTAQYIMGAYEGDAWESALETCQTWEAPIFPLSGRDALALGVTPGKVMGALLEQVEAWWIKKDFIPNKAACLAHMRALSG